MPTCDECGFESDSERGLSIHQASHDDGNKKRTYTCAECGDTFEDYESRREGGNGSGENFFCSRKCKYSFEESEKYYFDCTNCGDEVVRHPSAVDEMGDYEIRNHFCDKECESEWKSANWVGEDHPCWVDNTVAKTCDNCDEDIKVLEYYTDKLEHFFCGHRCHTEFQTQQTHIVCDYCDEEFELTPRQRMKLSEQDRMFCSDDCSSAWRSEFQRGENNPAWRGGKKTYYGPNWHEARRTVLERDNKKCQHCGLSRDEHYDRVGRDLEVHHRTPLREFDDNYEEANDPENLVTLCSGCHKKVEHDIVELAD